MTTAPRPFPTIQPPPAGGLAVAYFTPLMSPTPVAWRIPQPGNTADTINGFLRVEASGGTIRPDDVFYDVGVILHSYANNDQESMAEQVLAKAMGWGNNAMGTFITHPSTQVQYYVTYSRAVQLGIRQGDPLVNLTRFVGKLTWRIQGVYLPPPS